MLLYLEVCFFLSFSPVSISLLFFFPAFLLSREMNRLRRPCLSWARRKNVSPPIDATSYQHWLKETNNMSAKVSHGATGNNNNQHTKETRSPSSSTPNPDLKDAEPAYPSSFSHIVELITTGQPIPGIEDIPDTVLSGHEKPSTAERRRKPWEKAEEGSTSWYLLSYIRLWVHFPTKRDSGLPQTLDKACTIIRCNMHNA